MPTNNNNSVFNMLMAVSEFTPVQVTLPVTTAAQTHSKHLNQTIRVSQTMAAQPFFITIILSPLKLLQRR